MMRLLQTGRPPATRPRWVWLLTLLCACLLVSAGTAQSCHAHTALLHATDGKVQLSAPADECPFCAAPHASFAATTATSVERSPQQEAVPVPSFAAERFVLWSFDLFSRPPPVSARSGSAIQAGTSMAS